MTIDWGLVATFTIAFVLGSLALRAGTKQHINGTEIQSSFMGFKGI